MIDDTLTHETPELMRQRYGVEEVEGRKMGILGPVSEAGNPEFFDLRVQLLDEGRSVKPLAETSSMWTWMKVYASGGENVLHAHTNEDHMFLVLSGRAIFHGPNGEKSELGRNQGLMLPAGTLYSFSVSSEEPLVLLRVGARANDGDLKERFGADGAALPGGSEKNKFKPPMYREGAYYE